jgi:hypothetical protein
LNYLPLPHSWPGSGADRAWFFGNGRVQRFFRAFGFFTGNPTVLNNNPIQINGSYTKSRSAIDLMFLFRATDLVFATIQQTGFPVADGFEPR